MGPDVFKLHVAYPLGDAARVLAGWRDAVAGAPGALSTEAFIWSHGGGAIARVPAEATAFGARDGELMLGADAIRDAPEDDEANAASPRSSSPPARVVGRLPSATDASIHRIPPTGDQAATDAVDPRSAAIAFVTTEHFVLQGARSATIAEANGRANMFLAAVSGGLVALGLVATASSLGAAFYGFALVLLPTLAFVGLVSFGRALQCSIEDTEYARRIALLRGYYFGRAPEIAPYLLSVPPAERLFTQRVPGDRWQGFRTVAGMVAVITAVLAGSTATLAAILIFDHSPAAAVIAGTLVALPTVIAMIRHQDSAWERAAAEPLTAG